MTEWHPLRALEPNDGEESSQSSEERSRQMMWQKLDKAAEGVGRIIAKTSPAKMPTLNHASMSDYNNVYEPSDDTYLLIDAIKHDLFSGYPSDYCDGGEATSQEPKRQSASASASGNNNDNEEEGINRAALEYYYHPGRDARDSSDKNRGILRDLLDHEDGGFFADRLMKVMSRLQQLRRLERIQTVMEIGTGSGVPITYLSKRLLEEKPRPSHHNNDHCDFDVIATDLNPLALEFARKTAEENGVTETHREPGETHRDTTISKSNSNSNSNINGNSVAIRNIEYVKTDLAELLLADLGGIIDVLVFNPPYVPTDDAEISGTGIAISWAGGRDGRRVVDRALPQIAALLRKPDGVCYMITVDDNLPLQLATMLRDDHGLQMVPLVRRRARNEYLSVQKISWM